MFRSSADRLRALLTEAGDLLWADLDAAEDPSAALEDPERESFERGSSATHPHRRPLRWERSRRPGTVPARAAHCISPVRHPPASPPLPFPKAQ